MGRGTHDMARLGGAGPRRPTTVSLLLTSILFAVPLAGQDLPDSGPEPPRPSMSLFSGPVPHGGHGQSSPYLIDPLYTHHAILEDELRITNIWERRKTGGGTWGTSLELAYALTDAFGLEIFIPMLRTTDPSHHPESGLGDIELQALKWSFYRTPKLILTSALGGILPTGSEASGLGDGTWAVEPHLFLDAALGTAALQANLIYGFVQGGEQELEFSYSLAKVFLFGETKSAGPLIEFMGTRITRGHESGTWEQLGVAPGVKLQLGGWHIGVGVRFALLESEPASRQGLISVGYHVTY